MRRSKNAVKVTFEKLEEQTKKFGLTINERKTKFMQSARLRDKERNPLEIGNYSFEKTNSFT